MSDPSQDEPEKNRRSRSFGSFLLVLLVLLVVMVVVGNEPFHNPDKLSQDQYEWYLNQGDVILQEFKGNEQGTNLIEGKYIDKTRKEGTFRVNYASLDASDTERLRELKSIRSYRLVKAKTLLEGLESGDYTPIEARSLLGFLPKKPVAPADLPAEGDVVETTIEVAPARGEELTAQKLFVTVVAPGRQNAPESDLRLPETSGYLHLDVELGPQDDLGLLLGTLEAKGATVIQRTFDLAENATGGTFWKDATSPFGMILFYVAPSILVFVIFIMFMRQMRNQGGAGGVMSFGRSRAQLYSKESHTNVTFDDVAGSEEAKDEVRELVEFLKNPTRFTRIGGRIPRGVLLVGPPGCGKTLLAKAIAGEAEVPFFSISGSDFVEMFVGVGASRVRDLFKQARESSPCIIFLDEIDAVGRRRGSGMGGGHDEREQTLNAILVEMDGFGTDEGIIVVAATNRPDVLDPALLRPGRFDREVTCDLPDIEGRRAILGVHLKRVKSGSDVDLETLARSTPGYSGADLAAIINEAAIGAVLAKREEVTMYDLEEARDKVRYGRQKKSRKVEEEDRKITAYHEAGHAIVAAFIPETDPPHKVTIVPRGRALGSTMFVPGKESYHTQRGRLMAQLAMAFGGRVSESLFCGDISAGASDDIRRATDLARAMVSELGMSDKIGPINYSERQGSDFLGTELMRGKIHSEETAREIDQEVVRILTEAYQRAETILQTHRSAVEGLTQALLRYETISGDEVAQLLKGVSLDDLRPEADPKPPADPRPHTPERRLGKESERPGDLPGKPGLSPA